MRLRHVALVSSSEANAEKFYEGILKLRKIKTSVLKNDLALSIFKTDAECLLLLYENEDFAIEVFVTDRVTYKKAPFTHLCLEVEDREQFLASCRSIGLEINSVDKGDTKICFVQDLDGNLFEIK